MSLERVAGLLASVLTATLVTAALAGLATPAPAAAQEEAPRADAAERADTPGVQEYLREVFRYPEVTGRDPFRPLTDRAGTGPRFEDLRLAGILYNREIGSVAVLVDDAAARRYRVREGERVGEVRVVEIRSHEVEVSVAGVEGGRREVMRVKRDGEVPG